MLRKFLLLVFILTLAPDPSAGHSDEYSAKHSNEHSNGHSAGHSDEYSAIHSKEHSKEHHRSCFYDSLGKKCW
jgi:hypothetical protein